MQAEGLVSLWLGSANSRAAFDAALVAEFSLDGDFLGSPFSRGFGIGYYDDATREAVFFETAPKSLTAMLAGSSYADVTVPRFEALPVCLAPDDNCVVLLYEIGFAGETKRWRGDGVALRFLGSVAYGLQGGKRRTDDVVKTAILMLLRDLGPIGWYGLEIRLSIPRSEFKDGYTLMTYLEELIADGLVVRTTADGNERFVATEGP